MKRDEVKKLLGESATDDIVDSVMALHNKDLTKHQTASEKASAEVETLKAQLSEAGVTIESFKALKPDELKAAADEWKAKYEQAEKEHASKLVDIEFDKDFETALIGAKVKYTNEVKSRLNREELRDKNGKFIAERFTEQIKPIKESAADLFDTKTPAPKTVIGGRSQSTPKESTLADAIGQKLGLQGK
jgi:hypothetical protein